MSRSQSPEEVFRDLTRIRGGRPQGRPPLRLRGAKRLACPADRVAVQDDAALEGGLLDQVEFDGRHVATEE